MRASIGTISLQRLALWGSLTTVTIAALTITIIYALLPNDPVVVPVEEDSESVAIDAMLAALPNDVLAHVLLATSDHPNVPIGGGVCVSRSSEDCYVLTAAHVCTSPGIFAYDITGAIHEVELVDLDIATDLCLMRGLGEFPGVVRSMNINPPFHSEVTNVASPGGLYEPLPLIFIPKFEGRLVGISRDPFSPGNALMVTTVYASFGSSGSALMYNGSLIGIMQQIRADVRYLSFASLPDTTYRFLLRNGIFMRVARNQPR